MADPLLFEREKYFAHVCRVNERRTIWRTRIPRLLVLASLLAVAAAYLVVFFNRWTGIPEPIASYMWHTGIGGFDIEAFYAMCSGLGISETRANLYLAIYYGSVVSMLVFVAAWFWLQVNSIATRIREIRNPEKSLFYYSMRLLCSLEAFYQGSTRAKRREVTRLLLQFRIGQALSPLKDRWQDFACFEWFNRVKFDKETTRILGAAKAFDKRAIKCVQANSHLKELLEALESLATFSFIARARGETSFHFSTVDPNSVNSFPYLFEFAERMGRVQPKERAKPSFIQRVVEQFDAFVVQRLIGQIIAFAGLAGIVMAVGSFLLGISPRDAFLVWFTVVFGSMSITLGLQTVRGIRKK